MPSSIIIDTHSNELAAQLDRPSGQDLDEFAPPGTGFRLNAFRHIRRPGVATKRIADVDLTEEDPKPLLPNHPGRAASRTLLNGNFEDSELEALVDKVLEPPALLRLELNDGVLVDGAFDEDVIDVDADEEVEVVTEIRIFSDEYGAVEISVDDVVVAISNSEEEEEEEDDGVSINGSVIHRPKRAEWVDREDLDAMSAHPLAYDHSDDFNLPVINNTILALDVSRYYYNHSLTSSSEHSYGYASNETALISLSNEEEDDSNYDSMGNKRRVKLTPTRLLLNGSHLPREWEEGGSDSKLIKQRVTEEDVEEDMAEENDHHDNLSRADNLGEHSVQEKSPADDDVSSGSWSVPFLRRSPSRHPPRHDLSSFLQSCLEPLPPRSQARRTCRALENHPQNWIPLPQPLACG